MIELTFLKANAIYRAMSGKSTNDGGDNLFVNHYGEIIHCYNGFNYSRIGYIKNSEQFIIEIGASKGLHSFPVEK